MADIKPWDWEPRQIRLRYQMITTCLFFAALWIFDQGKISLPLIGELEITKHKRLVFWASVIGASYSILSFWMRSKVELSGKTEITEEYLKTLKNMNASLIDIQTSIDKTNNQDHTSIETTYSKLLAIIDAKKAMIKPMQELLHDYEKTKELVWKYTDVVMDADKARVIEFAIQQKFTDTSLMDVEEDFAKRKESANLAAEKVEKFLNRAPWDIIKVDLLDASTNKMEQFSDAVETVANKYSADVINSNKKVLI